MSTPLSSSTPYISVSDLGDCYDLRTICQLMSDGDGDVSENYDEILAILTNPLTNQGRRLLKIISQMSGKLESAIFSRGQYTPTDLAALSGMSLEYLKRVVADLVVRPCYERRPTMAPPMPQGADEADAILNALAQGVNVFGLQEVIDAGHMTMTVDTPANVVRRNSVVDRARGFFGLTNKRLLPTQNIGPNPSGNFQ